MDTEVVPARLQLNVASLTRFLQQSLPRLGSGDLSLLKFKHGESNPTYLVRAGNGAEAILRKRPPGKLLPGAHRVSPLAPCQTAVHSPCPST